MGRCRICKSKLVKIIDLGKIALVGNFLKKIKNLKNLRFLLIIVKIVNIFKFQKY